MIPKIENLDAAINVLRSSILTQTTLTSEFVINGKTLKGATPAKVVDNKVIPFRPNEVFIVFDVNPDNEDEVCMTELDETMTTYAGYTMRLVIYGNTSDDLAQLLFARLRSAEVKAFLRKSGVFITSISPVESTDEYINNIMWCRADMTVFFAVRYNFEKLTQFHKYERVNISIQKK